SAAWEQVGDQGSAFPQLVGDAISQTGGVSQTVNQSLTPTLKLDRFGSPTIAWMDGNAGQFDVFLKVFSPNGPGVMTGTTFTTNLTQTDSVALTPIAKGSSTVQTAINLSASVYTETLLSPLGTSLQLQVEVVPVGSPFTGLPTPALTSLPTAPGGTATVFVTGLPNGNYVWAARTIDQFGRFSPWVEFGGPTSFVVNTFGGVGGGGGGGGGGGSGPPPSNSGGPSKGSCGLTGLEGILALLLVRRLRRK